MGGVLGGLKYLINEGIFFKFAEDEQCLFETDLWYQPAAKIAGHELKNCTVLHNINDAQLNLSLPLICLVDYLGHRVIAIAACPIGKATLVLGSMDAGKTMLQTDTVLHGATHIAAQKLNLAPHVVHGVTIALAFDLEGHVGRDGRRYLVDLSRLMPPQARTSARCGHLYQLLRPELVAKLQKPLCADVYSCFLGTRTDQAEYIRDVKDATRLLMTSFIPECALELDRLHFLPSKCFFTLSHLRTLMHLVSVHGVNKRFLGRVRRYAKHHVTDELLSIEIAARALKVRISS